MQARSLLSKEQPNWERRRDDHRRKYLCMHTLQSNYWTQVRSPEEPRSIRSARTIASLVEIATVEKRVHHVGRRA